MFYSNTLESEASSDSSRSMMSESSPELFAFILANESVPDEGVTVEHVSQNYSGSDRPKKKIEAWLRSLEHIEMFEWEGKVCCKVKNCPLKETIKNRKGKDYTRPSSSRQRKSFCLFRANEADDMKRKATFLYEQTNLLVKSKDHFWNEAIRFEIMSTLEEMMRLTKESTVKSKRVPQNRQMKRYPTKETVHVFKPSVADSNDPFFGSGARYADYDDREELYK